MRRLLLLCVVVCCALPFPSQLLGGETDDIIKEAKQTLLKPWPDRLDLGVYDRPKKRVQLVARHGKAILPALKDLARHKDANVRMNAIMGIGDLLGSSGVANTDKDAIAKDTLGLVMEKFRDKSFSVRYAAMGVSSAIYLRTKDPVVANNLLGVLFSRTSPLEKAGAARALTPIVGFKVGDITSEDTELVAAATEEVRKWFEANKGQLNLMILRPAKEVETDLGSSKPEVRERAVREMQARGQAADAPKICKLLRTERNATVFKAAREAVGSLTGIPIKVALADPASKRDATIKAWLTWYGLQPHIQTLRTGSPKQRLASVRQIAQAKHPRVKEVLCDHLIRENDVKTAKTVQKALKDITGVEIVVDLKLDAAGRAERIRRWNVWIEAKPELDKALAQKAPARRARLIRGLSLYKHAEVVHALLGQVVKETDERVNTAIADTVLNITGRSLGITPGMTPEQMASPLSDFKKWWDKNKSRFQ